jgi:hypothetical protein
MGGFFCGGKKVLDSGIGGWRQNLSRGVPSTPDVIKK